MRDREGRRAQKLCRLFDDMGGKGRRFLRRVGDRVDEIEHEREAKQLDESREFEHGRKYQKHREHGGAAIQDHDKVVRVSKILTQECDLLSINIAADPFVKQQQLVQSQESQAANKATHRIRCRAVVAKYADAKANAELAPSRMADSAVTDPRSLKLKSGGSLDGTTTNEAAM